MEHPRKQYTPGQLGLEFIITPPYIPQMGDFAVARVIENGKIRRKPSPLQGDLGVKIN